MTRRPGPAELAQLEQRAFRWGAQALYGDPALYDQLYVRRKQDIQFYVEFARTIGGPVLELGAGSGRVTLALARAGLDVTGIEAMAPMLARARERLAALPATERRRVTLKHGDMRTLRLTPRFRLIVAPFNVLLHLASADELLAVLQRLRGLLSPTGRLVLDVQNPDLHALAQDPDRRYRAGAITHPRTGVRYRLSESTHYAAATQIRTTLMHFDPVGGGEPLVVPLSHRQIFPQELLVSLHAAGFGVCERFGDFDRRPFDDASEVQIVVAKPLRMPLRTTPGSRVSRGRARVL